MRAYSEGRRELAGNQLSPVRELSACGRLPHSGRDRIQDWDWGTGNWGRGTGGKSNVVVKGGAGDGMIGGATTSRSTEYLTNSTDHLGEKEMEMAGEATLRQGKVLKGVVVVVVFVETRRDETRKENKGKERNGT